MSNDSSAVAERSASARWPHLFSFFFVFPLSLFFVFFFAVVTVATDGSIGRCHGDAPPSPKDDKGDANELGPHYFETTSKLHRFFYRFTSGKKRKQKKSSSHTRNQRPEDFFLGRGGVADPSKSGIPAHFSFFLAKIGIVFHLFSFNEIRLSSSAPTFFFWSLGWCESFEE